MFEFSGNRQIEEKFPINTKLMPAFIVGFTCIGNLAFGDATENVRVQSTILFLSISQLMG